MAVEMLPKPPLETYSENGKPRTSEELPFFNRFIVKDTKVVSRNGQIWQIDVSVAGWQPELKRVDPLCRFAISSNQQRETCVRIEILMVQ